MDLIKQLKKLEFKMTTNFSRNSVSFKLFVGGKSGRTLGHMSCEEPIARSAFSLKEGEIICSSNGGRDLVLDTASRRYEWFLNVCQTPDNEQSLELLQELKARPTKFTLAICQFDLVRQPSGQILGYLHCEDLPISIGNDTRREILQVSDDGHSAWFTAGVPYYTWLLEKCPNSINREETQDLLKKLQAQDATPDTSIEVATPLDLELDEELDPWSEVPSCLLPLPQIQWPEELSELYASIFKLLDPASHDLSEDLWGTATEVSEVVHEAAATAIAKLPTVAELRDQCDRAGIIWKNARGRGKHLLQQEMIDQLKALALA